MILSLPPIGGNIAVKQSQPSLATTSTTATPSHGHAPSPASRDIGTTCDDKRAMTHGGKTLHSICIEALMDVRRTLWVKVGAPLTPPPPKPFIFLS